MIINIILSAALAQEAGGVGVGADGVTTPPEAPVDEVFVITATATPTPLSDAPVATEVIDRAALEASGALTLDQVLDQVAGVQLLDGFRGTGVSLRGHDPAHTLILVDGRRTLGRVAGSLDLRRFPVDRIERVEIVRGPTSALYGADALGGVVHILTRDAADGWSADLTGAAGGYVGLHPRVPTGLDVDGTGQGLDQLDGDLALSYGRGPVSARVALSALSLDAWDRDLATVSTDGDAQRTITPSARLTADTGVGRLTVDAEGSVQDGRGVDATATGAVFDRLHRTTTWAVGLGLRSDLPRGVTLDVHLDGGSYRDELRQDQRRSDAMDTLELTRESIGRAVVTADGDLPAREGRERRHHLLGGAEVMLEEVSADRLAEDRVGRQRGALFVQHQWRAWDDPGLVVLSGVRLDMDSQFGVFPAPRLAVRLDPHPMVRLRLAGGLGFRAPDFKQLYLDFANPGVGYRISGSEDLRPERSVGGTLDLEVDPHRLVGLTVSGWHDGLRDLITTDLTDPGGAGQPAAYGYVNIGRARVQGLTTGLRVGDRRTVAGRLAWTFTDADDLDALRPLPGRAEHQLTAGLDGTWDRAGLTASVSLNALGPRPFYPSEDQVVLLPWTALIDARIAWQVTPALQLHAGIDNAADVGAALLDGTRPRRVYGGLTVHLAGDAGRPSPETLALSGGPP